VEAARLRAAGTKSGNKRTRRIGAAISRKIKPAPASAARARRQPPTAERVSPDFEAARKRAASSIQAKLAGIISLAKLFLDTTSDLAETIFASKMDFRQRSDFFGIMH
jgi:hypothetical protein